jgi:pimeloyl-ACP methyl ester carboxylesterase
MEPFWLVALWVDGIGLGQVPQPIRGIQHLERTNHRLCGRVLDFTFNHGADRRIWSPALGQRRDLYVYLPPGFDPSRRYPLAIFLHGAAQDERFFLQTQVEHFDRAMAEGRLPPAIIAAPDGSVHGRATLRDPTTFWANSRVGRFEDFVMGDVWDFLMRSFPIRPEREAHALVGASAGGSAAFALAIKHRDRVKVAMGFMPLLNLRYVDGRGRYRTDFDPGNVGLRDRLHGLEALGRRRLFVLNFGTLFVPLFGRGPDAVAGMASINPLELMEQHDLQNGELDLYVAYGGQDEFNVKAQVDSFLYYARRRGIEVTSDFDPRGRHDAATGLRQLPAALRWASAHMAAGPSVAREREPVGEAVAVP